MNNIHDICVANMNTNIIRKKISTNIFKYLNLFKYLKNIHAQNTATYQS